jgi:hypothetical protein
MAESVFGMRVNPADPAIRSATSGIVMWSVQTCSAKAGPLSRARAEIKLRHSEGLPSQRCILTG